MEDEGIGVHVVNKLEKDFEFSPSIQLIDGGVTGTDLLPYLEENDRVIIVDAVNFGQEPGFIGSVENDDILTRLTTKMSLHHLGITDVLSSLKLLGTGPDELYLVGIQPASITLKMEMSELIAKRMNRIIEVVLLKLEEWQVSVLKKM
jgi:hydrogenase maturation protease